MDAQEFFATEWPLLAPQLRAALARAGAPTADREDLVQETAVRLLATWDNIDWERGPQALARTIALNAWRDQWRRRGEREVIGEVPEQPAAHETERVAMARLEVREVSRALRLLRPATAAVLRVAAAEAEDQAATSTSAAVRMARTRARRALAASLKVASAVAAGAVLGLRWIGRPVRSTVAIGAMAGVAWMLALGSAPTGHGPTWQAPTAAAQGAPDVAAHPSAASLAGFTGQQPAARASAHPRARVHDDPPYVVNAGPTQVSILLTVDVEGYGAQVRQPAPGNPVPACTFGDTPSNPAIAHCPTH